VRLIVAVVQLRSAVVGLIISAAVDYAVAVVAIAFVIVLGHHSIVVVL